MKVLKFGGTSVGSPESIKQVIGILRNYYNNNIQLTVVFSAFSGVTDQLIELAKLAKENDTAYHSIYHNLRLRHFRAAEELLRGEYLEEAKNILSELFEKLSGIVQGINLLGDLSPRTMDMMLSFGEQLSCNIITQALKSEAIPAEYIFSADIIKTNNQFGGAKVNFSKTNKLIREKLSAGDVVKVVTGFIGSTENNEITTLGRGGSDYTAAILGAALDAEEIEIWTDVNGIMTADPRKVRNSIPLKAVTYREAMELSHFGAKVIHPPTMQPAFEKKIKIRIRNTFNPASKGTIILDKDPNIKFNAKGISSLDNISLLRIEGSALITNRNASSRIFDSLSRANITILFITQGSSGYSLCIGVPPEDGETAKKVIEDELKLELLEGLIDEIMLEKELALLAVVGEDMRATPGISGTIFNALGKNGINIKAIAQGSSELNVSCVIKNSDLRKALNVIHNAMFLSEKKVINLFLAGPGLVGSSVLEYIEHKKKYILQQHSTELRVVGITNSKKMLFEPSGIQLDSWKEQLENSSERADAEAFVNEMINMNLANSIFIDSTANETFVDKYIRVLNESIAIVTPNKIANTKDYKFYSALKEAEKKHLTQFKYSTNVGAALPVISTIQRLILAGEKIQRIEAILSGSLSYIFNSFTDDRKFSEIVSDAKDNGYTEPDPRDDLSGLDMARKLLIILRESGHQLELSDLQIENILPDEVLKANVKDVIAVLEKHNDYFERLKQNAAKNNSKLKYIASFDGTNAKIALEEVNAEHPFYNLTGTENIIAIYSDNHSNIPLVLRGKGAGAEYTAFGIFSDIMEITKYLG